MDLEQTLGKNNVAEDPIEQFSMWYRQAEESGIKHPNAMTLATATHSGIPSARIVLLKEFDYNGFVFYTNYNSRKGKELAENLHAALLFYWKELDRQIRIEGIVKEISGNQSGQYFQTRPRDSQLGAWASDQSEIISNRLVLEKKYDEYKKRYEDKKAPRPPSWGGYILTPKRIEFWQNRQNRLHDRICYLFINGKWAIERLSP